MNTPTPSNSVVTEAMIEAGCAAMDEAENTPCLNPTNRYLAEVAIRAAISAMQPTMRGEGGKRPYGDAGDAIDWGLDHMPKRDDLRDFLEAWREDYLRDYADYLRWVRVQQEAALEAHQPSKAISEPEGNA